MIPLLAGLLFLAAAEGSARDPSMSPDGSRIAFVADATGQFEVHVMDADGANPRRLTDGGEPKFYPHFSPDGKRLVFTTFGPGGGHGGGAVWTLGLDGLDLARVTPEDEHGVDGRWSPDGADIYYAGRRDGNEDVCVIAVGGGAARRLTRHPARDMTPSPSPDGERVTFVSDRDGTWDVFVMAADGSGARNLTRSPLHCLVPSWHPDGRRVVYYCKTPDAGVERDDIYVVDVESGEVVRLTDNGVRDFCPRFTTDGEALLFASTRSGALAIHRLELASGATAQLTRGP